MVNAQHAPNKVNSERVKNFKAFAVFFAASLALLTQTYGIPAAGKSFDAASLEELLSALVQEGTIDEMFNGAEVEIEGAPAQNEFELEIIGCDELTSKRRAILTRYLQQYISRKVTISCSGSEKSGSGKTYTRWGHDACPGQAGTELIYTGRMAGAFYKQKGGGANYLCLSNNPQYDEITTDLDNTYLGSYSHIYGTEYEVPLVGLHDHGVPCAVCSSIRPQELMIPGQTRCPTGWTREYFGYIMAESNFADRSRNEYVCIDKEQKSLPGSEGNQDGNLIYHARAICHGINCPPYNERKALTCVVCSK